VKELLKSANISQSYSKNKGGPVFFDSQCSLILKCASHLVIIIIIIIIIITMFLDKEF